MKELEFTLASVFKRSGKAVLTPKDFQLYISMELKWFSPGETQALVKNGIRSGLLLEKPEGLAPNFDVGKVNVPMSFKPSKKVLESMDDIPVFLRIVDKIARATDSERSDVISKINRKQSSLRLSIEVVALLYAVSLDVDVKPFLEDVEKELIERVKEEPATPAPVRF